MANFGLCVLPNGLIWEYISSSENDFLYDEIFCRRAYLRHGIVISDGDIIVDAGANIGIFAIFSSTVASQLTVLCIEPIPTVVNVLRRNLSQCAKSYPTNSFSVVCAAIADIESESEQFVYFESNPGESTRHIEEQAAQHHTLMAAAEESEYSEICELYHDESPSAKTPFTCRVCTLEKLSKEFNLTRIDLLKIDVEGDELAALQGLLGSFAITKQIVAEVHDINGRLEAVRDLLISQGYNVIVEQQRVEVAEDGYISFIPEQMKLFYVYARRIPVES